MHAGEAFLGGDFLHAPSIPDPGGNLSNPVGMRPEVSRYACRMPVPGGVTLLDLRPEPLRAAQPLGALLPHHRLVTLSLDEIEDARHGLTPADGPLLVLCERGVRSQLAARFLRADGLNAESYPGGVPALLRELPR